MSERYTMPTRNLRYQALFSVFLKNYQRKLKKLAYGMSEYAYILLILLLIVFETVGLAPDQKMQIQQYYHGFCIVCLAIQQKNQLNPLCVCVRVASIVKSFSFRDCVLLKGQIDFPLLECLKLIRTKFFYKNSKACCMCITQFLL